jgi:hypothetical protein
MDAGVERADGEIDVVPVGRGEVDGVDGSGGEELVVLVVAVERDAAGIFVSVAFLFLADLLGFLLVAGDEGNDFAVLGVLDAGEKGGLRDPADANDSVTDFAVFDDDGLGHSELLGAN